MVYFVVPGLACPIEAVGEVGIRNRWGWRAEISTFPLETKSLASSKPKLRRIRFAGMRYNKSLRYQYFSNLFTMLFSMLCVCLDGCSLR